MEIFSKSIGETVLKKWQQEVFYNEKGFFYYYDDCVSRRCSVNNICGGKPIQRCACRSLGL